ncbi:DUF1778 domain-containing protein [Thiocapsa rosea]|uniref:Uncharacterized protein (DUF1778 family) n=1 Tax=Thiocapsa rosea TaxID=69360 RepID=A0A495V8Z5_9GAMM|nr:DUF1778 domain-containing protein [Thiocapsa rosea]RKT45764.1 uncharacterized protein (DUF1778 family) [Thiocapsa rosea]
MSEAIERFDIRLPANAKQMLMQAADISGNTLTGLVLNAALDKAREILRSHQHFILNAEEWRRFADTLDNPPEPNDALQAAWRDYRDAEPE